MWHSRQQSSRVSPSRPRQLRVASDACHDDAASSASRACIASSHRGIAIGRAEHKQAATMEREGYLRSLPYLYPSTWPAPLAARAYGGSYIRKLMFPGYVVSIEPSSSCQPGTLGPAFFLTNDETAAADTGTDGGAPAIDNDPALCPFEVSVLVPKSIAGVSPGASSASTAFASSQSPVGTTPAAAGKATPVAAAATSAAPPMGGLSDTPKQADTAPAPEPILYFRFGGNGTYCVNYSCIHRIEVETGNNGLAANNQTTEADGSQGDDTVVQGASSVPPSVVVSFDTCAFRIFRLAKPPDHENDDAREEQLKNLRLFANELTASLRAAGSFVAPSSPSTGRESSGDTEISDRASLEEDGQLNDGIGLESSGGTCSEGKGRSTDCDTNILQMSDDGKGTSKSSQQTLTAEEDTQRRLADAKEVEDSQSGCEAQTKRRRVAYNQSIAAIDCIATSSTRRRIGSGAAAQTQMSSFMTTAATALATSYEEGSAGQSSEDRVDQITASLDGIVSELIPLHTRVKHQRGGVLSSLSMSSPPPARRPGSLDSTASAAAPSGGPLGDESVRDVDELRDVARKMIEEYREAIAAKHRSDILPTR